MKGRGAEGLWAGHGRLGQSVSHRSRQSFEVTDGLYSESIKVATSGLNFNATNGENKPKLSVER